MEDNLPDPKAYQVNRRRMCWLALAMMGLMVAAIIYDPVAYKASDMAPLFYGLSGLVAVYFGATSYQQAKK